MVIFHMSGESEGSTDKQVWLNVWFNGREIEVFRECRCGEVPRKDGRRRRAFVVQRRITLMVWFLVCLKRFTVVIREKEPRSCVRRVDKHRLSVSFRRAQYDGHGSTEVVCIIGSVRENRESLLGFFGGSFCDRNRVTDGCRSGHLSGGGTRFPLPSQITLSHLSALTGLSPSTYKPTRFTHHGFAPYVG